jgi:hypothetical protein
MELLYRREAVAVAFWSCRIHITEVKRRHGKCGDSSKNAMVTYHTQQSGCKTEVHTATFHNIHRISKDDAYILVKRKRTSSPLPSDGGGKQ